MRIVFLALAFPNMEQSNYLYTELVTELHNEGHEILVVAPAYDPKRKGLVLETGIKVLRVPTLELFGSGLIMKGVANLLLPYLYKRALKNLKTDLNFDLIITATPPITLYNVVAWLKKKSNGKVYLILRDIFPQNAVDLGFMKEKSFIHWFFRSKEKKLYAISDSIGCMSEGNISYLEKHNPEIDKKKLHLLPNWANLLPLQSNEINRQLKKQEGLEGKFIVVFGGNIGIPQKMENIVDLALACKDKTDMLFLIVGVGSALEDLKNLIASKEVFNIQLRKGLKHKEYFELLQITDVGLISLSDQFTIPNYPSKALSYFNAKKPILASLDLSTDFGEGLEKINAGLWAEAGDTSLLKEKLMLLYNDSELRKQMGENGYNHMKTELTSKKAFETVINEISKL
jgi:glycosyltransferase involved in cell wall biosynthesis